MADEHPLERLLRDAKEKDDLKAAALVAEQRKALDLQDKVRLQWVRTKAELIEEIGRANAVLEKHGLPERFTLPRAAGAGVGQYRPLQSGVGVSREVAARRVRPHRAIR